MAIVEQPPPDAPERTALYRLYGTSGQLLYVGVSSDPEARWLQHRGDKHWWPQVTRKSLEWYNTRREALDAERDAIAKESPRRNWTHNKRVRDQLRREAREYERATTEYVTADPTIPARRSLPGESVGMAEAKALEAEAEGDARGAAYWWQVKSIVDQAPPLSPEQISKLRVIFASGDQRGARE